MTTETKRLGKGLKDLLGPTAAAAPTETEAGSLIEVDVSKIHPNRHQPRERFDAQDLQDLAGSIKEHGILQPILVRRDGDGYEIVAGERRWRAAKQSGASTVPVVVRDAVDDGQLMEMALVENVQRTDLNPIEKARGFRALQERLGLTQEDVARRIGKDRSTVANFLRLLDLPESVQDSVSRGTISMGHARALLSIADPVLREEVHRRIPEEGLSVREVEQLASAGRTSRPRSRVLAEEPIAWVDDVQKRLSDHLEAQAKVHRGRSGKGWVKLSFADDEDLQRLLDAIGLPADGV